MAKGVLKVISNDELNKQQQQADGAMALAREETAVSQLAAHIKTKFEYMRWHRNQFNLTDRYLASLRAYNGHYGPGKLAEIQQFGGSTVYARITATKCRAATALLRDVYLGGERPWNMNATPLPDVPEDVNAQIEQLVGVEAQQMSMVGEKVDQGQMQTRVAQLQKGALRAAKKDADVSANESSIRVEDILVEGGFYTALREFLTDLPMFPFACIKGPEVRMNTEMKWVEGKLERVTIPRMFWKRVSPFDFYIDGSATHTRNADVIERIKLTRSDLNLCLGVKGYNDDNIRKVLNEYEHGLQDWLDDDETQRANEESKENPYLNRSDMIDTLEYHGKVKGSWLIEYGFTEEQIEDPDKDYSVACWLVGQYAIKVHINPNPKQHHPYYTTSYEKIPGSVYGNSLPEIIGDLQDVCNATLRSLVNNMSIASGPQVMVNEERLSPTTNADSLYPWKRWRFVSDPMGDKSKPVDFFQPESNATELLGVYAKMSEIADEVSAIPRYMTGDAKVGGAASTASGLSMLMANVSKAMQTVAAQVDDDVLEPALRDLYEMILLTDPSPNFKGDSKIQVRGVAVAVQKETERMRKLEMLQLTANPMDYEIIGKNGRAAMLRDITDDLGMPGVDIVPDNDTLEAQDQANAAQGAAGAAQAQGNQPQSSQNQTGGNASEQTQNMHRTGV
jgi:hypothetical protein